MNEQKFSPLTAQQLDAAHHGDSAAISLIIESYAGYACGIAIEISKRSKKFRHISDDLKAEAFLALTEIANALPLLEDDTALKKYLSVCVSRRVSDAAQSDGTITIPASTARRRKGDVPKFEGLSPNLRDDEPNIGIERFEFCDSLDNVSCPVIQAEVIQGLMNGVPKQELAKQLSLSRAQLGSVIDDVAELMEEHFYEPDFDETPIRRCHIQPERWSA